MCDTGSTLTLETTTTTTTDVQLKTTDNENQRLEDAVRFFIKAGVLFKSTKKWVQAGLAFSEAANSCRTLRSDSEAADHFIEAAMCLQKYDFKKALDCYSKAKEIYLKNEKPFMAAKMYIFMAELREEINMSEALNCYEKAVELLRGISYHLTANKYAEKIADQLALEKHYRKAIKLFEEIACYELAASPSTCTTKKYLFKASICMLCKDLHKTKLETDKYSEVCPAYQNSREYELIKSLANYLDDPQNYVNIINSFKKTLKLSYWHKTMIYRLCFQNDSTTAFMFP